MKGRWKAKERDLARILGGTRAGPTGKEGPDVLHPIFAPELKTMTKLPKWFMAFLEQAERNAPPGKLPMVVMQEKGMHMLDCPVTVRMRDWIQWYGPIEEVVQPTGEVDAPPIT